MLIRYIRDYIKGSTANTNNHWVEIQAYDNFIAGTNIALNKGVTCSNGLSANIALVTNGDINTANYFDGGVSGDGVTPIYVTVDLGGIYDIKRIKIFHYSLDFRTYFNKKLEISSDGMTWYTIYDESVNGNYTESSNGVEYFLADNMLELKNSFSDLTFNFSDYYRGGTFIKNIPGNYHIPIASSGMNFKKFVGYKKEHTTVFSTESTTSHTTSWYTTRSTTISKNATRSTSTSYTTKWSTGGGEGGSTSKTTSKSTTTTFLTSFNTTTTFTTSLLTSYITTNTTFLVITNTI